MLILYLVCLIFGGSLLAFSILFGGEHGQDGGAHQIDFHHAPEIGTHADAPHSLEAGYHDLEHAHHDGSHESADAVKFVSFRNFIYFTAFFGLTGSILTWMNTVALLSLPASVLIGFISAFSGYKFLKYLKANESGEAVNIFDLKGKPAKVAMHISKTNKGKVSVQVSGQTVQLVAIASEIAQKDEFFTGEDVLIIEVKNDIVYVIESDLPLIQESHYGS